MIEEPLYAWPGTYAGYKDAVGKYHKGTSATLTAIPAKIKQNANYWRNGKFCLRRVVSTRLVGSTNGVCAAG